MKDEGNMRRLKEMWYNHQNMKENYDRLTDWWEDGKQKIKKICITIGKTSKKQINEERKNLQTKLERLIASDDPKTAKEIMDTKKKIKDIEEAEMEGAALRSRVQWQQEGEKCTRYFFSLEKRKGGDRQIKELVDKDGNTYNTKKETLEYVKKFYVKKYKNTDLNNDNCEILLDTITRRLTNEQRDEQAGSFTMSELESVMKKMKKNSSPGSDGLTTEFYIQCWDFMRHDLLLVFNEISATRCLPLSMTQALITLLFKNKGSKTDLNNWRAISLCNVDYKMLTGMMSARIERYLTELIHPDQSCGISGRNSSDQLIYIQDIMDHIQRHGGRAFVYGLDLKAAFDNVEHEYFHRVMERMNIGFKLRDLLKLIYGNMYSSVLLNGAKTPYFKLEKSIRTGDKIAMTCFIMTIEPLANLVRQSQQIHRLRLPNTQPKCVSMHCDDANILSTNADDILEINAITKQFEQGSGAVFNASKSEIILVGQWSPIEIQKFPKENIKISIRLLGVWFGKDSQMKNHTMILDKIDEKLEFWKNIPLSYDGKRLIINTKILPQFYHVIRVTGLDDRLRKAVQKRITDFIWHPKKMRLLPYTTLQNTTEKGGLDMPNLENINRAILTERIARALNFEPIWTGMFIYRLGFALRDLKIEYASPKYAHTPIQTCITTIILETYRKLKNDVGDWRYENFNTLKKRLHANTEYRRSRQRDYSDTWTNVQNSTNDRKRKDISYLLAHEVLPIATFLKNHHIVQDASCRLCGKEDETISHLFLKCRMITPTVKLVEKLIGRTLSEEALIFYEGLGGRIKKKERNAIATLKQAVWITRAKIFSGEIYGSTEIEQTVINVYKNRLKF